MSVTREALKDATAAAITQIEQYITSKASGNVRDFAQIALGKYISGIDDDDFLHRDAQSWGAVILNHLAFAHEFKTGAPKIQIFTPTLAEHGWHANATVIEFINDDMPFLVDSIAMEINRLGIAIKQIAHPLYEVTRDKKGILTDIKLPTPGNKLESWIHFEVERLTDANKIKDLQEGLLSVLGDVRAAVEDWPAMKAQMPAVLADMRNADKAVPAERVTEARDFLTWVGDNHFTFLGFREYELAVIDGKDVLKIVPGSGLGVLRDKNKASVSASFNELPENLRKLAREPRLLVLTKANSRATVHRPGYLDYVGIKKFDANGQVIGERRFIGLYTSSSYHCEPVEIPLLRRKVLNVMQRAGFPPASHAGKNLRTILDGYPRDELFQIVEDDLFEIALGILHLGERARTRLFIRRDVYARFYSCLIYLPRENFNTEVRVKLQDLLKQSLNGTSTDFTVQLTESVLARIHMLVRTHPSADPMVDRKKLEEQIIALTRRWEEGVFATVMEKMGEDAANTARHEFVQPFPAAYREDVGPTQAIDDFAASRRLSDAQPLAVCLYDNEADAQKIRVRVYHLGAPVTLSDALPMLENMGAKVISERAYKIERHNAPPIHIHEYGLIHRVSGLNFDSIKTKFEQTFIQSWSRSIENDGFNRLTLSAGLAADEVLILRMYAKYLKQTGFTFSQTYVEQTLADHAAVSRDLVKLFHCRFDPAAGSKREASTSELVASITAQLENIANADDDRILRRFLAAMQATLRTNFYQRKEYLSIKIASAKIPELPEPKPLYEIFVYSPRVEGIHMRFGKVARGGLRWSDRPEDFRTEVLGLVKAQQVKNAVIVPVGSKGGFVLKMAPTPGDREAFMKEGIACYKNFLRGLLDLTDNLVKGKIVPPKYVVRHDGDDPYLVVAADKGTATFSDYANGISAEYGHWLGDAFASGGSAGYDHKKMGITARGAWESVKRHFREFDVDTQTTDFTVVGVGDMSGDVFGNGMLLSKHICLVAAFDHRHIFLDPSPDPAKSFAERARLFALPRSSWDDYDKALLSKGGGVFPRGAKNIALTSEVKTVLGIDGEIATLTPVELMRAILKAPVDLFYNGGIGTYLKASHQSNLEVGDKANDAIRINGDELRCKVVAEGGNLGATQLARVEAAMAGVRICTDAIDNSAGVDCSDHEVNIKILLGAALDAGLLTAEDREPLLASMTDEVGLLVLKDNYFQTQSLSVSGVRADKLLDAQAHYMRHLEKAGRLKRAVEFLPDEDEINVRREKKTGLTAPERAVLLAYSKMELYDELLLTDLIDDPYVAKALVTYFPTPLQARFKDVMINHPLKREIIATEIANGTINRTGSVFISRMREETGATAPEVVRSFLLTREIFGISQTWQEIDSLDNKVPTAIQNEMLIEVGRLVLRATLWFLRRRSEQMAFADVLKFFAEGVATVEGELLKLLSAEDRQALEAHEARLVGKGVPSNIAGEVARTDAIYAALDIVEASTLMARSAAISASVYFSLTGNLSLRWLNTQVTALPTDTHWQAMARAAMRDDVANLKRQLTESVLKLSPAATTGAAAIEAWEKHHAKDLARMREIMTDLQAARETDLAMLSVLLRELRGLI